MDKDPYSNSLFSQDFYYQLSRLRDRNILNIFELLLQEPAWKDKNFSPDFDEDLYNYLAKSPYLQQQEKDQIKENVKYILQVCRNISYLFMIENSTGFINFYNKNIVSHIWRNFQLKKYYELLIPKIFYRLFGILSDERNEWTINKSLVLGFVEQNWNNFLNPQIGVRIKNSLFDIKNLLANIPEKYELFSTMKNHFSILNADLHWQEFLNIIEDLNRYETIKFWKDFLKNQLRININNLLRKINIAWWRTHPDKWWENFSQTTNSKEIIFWYLKTQLAKLED